MKENLNDRIDRAVRAWPQWSRAERRRMDDVVADVLHHMRTGEGNGFIRWFCERHLPNLLNRAGEGER